MQIDSLLENYSLASLSTMSMPKNRSVWDLVYSSTRWRLSGCSIFTILMYLTFVAFPIYKDVMVHLTPQNGLRRKSPYQRRRLARRTLLRSLFGRTVHFYLNLFLRIIYQEIFPMSFRRSPSSKRTIFEEVSWDAAYKELFSTVFFSYVAHLILEKVVRPRPTLTAMMCLKYTGWSRSWATFEVLKGILIKSVFVLYPSSRKYDYCHQ